MLSKLDAGIGSLSDLFPDTIGFEATHEVVDVTISTSWGVGRLDLTKWGSACLVLALIQGLPSLEIRHIAKRAWLVSVICTWGNRGNSKARIQEWAFLSLNWFQLLHGIRMIVISSRFGTCDPSRPLAVCPDERMPPVGRWVVSMPLMKGERIVNVSFSSLRFKFLKVCRCVIRCCKGFCANLVRAAPTYGTWWARHSFLGLFLELLGSCWGYTNTTQAKQISS
jgi:hypothetical protein